MRKLLQPPKTPSAAYLYIAKIAADAFYAVPQAQEDCDRFCENLRELREQTATALYVGHLKNLGLNHGIEFTQVMDGRRGWIGYYQNRLTGARYNKGDRIGITEPQSTPDEAIKEICRLIAPRPLRPKKVK